MQDETIDKKKKDEEIKIEIHWDIGSVSLLIVDGLYVWYEV